MEKPQRTYYVAAEYIDHSDRLLVEDADEVLQFALKRFGAEVTPAQHAATLKAYLQLSAYPEVPTTLSALVPRPCLILSNGAPRMLVAAVE